MYTPSPALSSFSHLEEHVLCWLCRDGTRGKGIEPGRTLKIGAIDRPFHGAAGLLLELALGKGDALFGKSRGDHCAFWGGSPEACPSTGPDGVARATIRRVAPPPIVKREERPHKRYDAGRLYRVVCAIIARRIASRSAAGLRQSNAMSPAWAASAFYDRGEAMQRACA